MAANDYKVRIHDAAILAVHDGRGSGNNLCG